MPTRHDPAASRSGAIRWLFRGALVGLALALPTLVIGIPDTVRIPMLEERVDDEPNAVFSHWQHNQYQCYSCHPSLFPQRKLGFTHEDMSKGLYCGGCHDGRMAFDVDDRSISCDRCHVGGAAEIDDIDVDDLFD